MTYSLVTIIAPESISSKVAEMCALLAGEAGEGMFTAKLSQTGSKPVTHAISSGLFESEFVSLINDKDSLLAALLAAGYSVSSTEIDAIFQASIITTDSAYDALLANNLKNICEV